MLMLRCVRIRLIRIWSRPVVRLVRLVATPMLALARRPIRIRHGEPDSFRPAPGLNKSANP